MLKISKILQLQKVKTAIRRNLRRPIIDHPPIDEQIVISRRPNKRNQEIFLLKKHSYVPHPCFKANSIQPIGYSYSFCGWFRPKNR